MISTRRCNDVEVCFTVFVFPAAIIVALALLEILSYGGEL
jgi:hypothetical protein